jgi:allantoin racemase
MESGSAGLKGWGLMRILVINPNSDPTMTRTIERAAKSYARDRFQVLCLPTHGAPHFIDSYLDELQTAPGMLELLRQHEELVDAIVVACMDDPNLDALKEASRKPVVGIAEAAMKIASMIGHRFSILSTSKASVANHQVLARKYLLQDALASVRYPGADELELDPEEQYLRTGRAALEQDMAEVLVLGCAGLADLAGRLEQELGVPVLDGVICGLILAEGMARAGVAISKAGRYLLRDQGNR